MAAGTYRQRIRIEAPTRTTQADGQEVITWPNAFQPAFLTLWANVVLSRAEQSEHHHQQQTHVGAVIRCRSSVISRRITPGMRVRFLNELYEIASAEDPDFRGVELVIRATSIRKP